MDGAEHSEVPLRDDTVYAGFSASSGPAGGNQTVPDADWEPKDRPLSIVERLDKHAMEVHYEPTPLDLSDDEGEKENKESAEADEHTPISLVDLADAEKRRKARHAVIAKN